MPLFVLQHEEALSGARLQAFDCDRKPYKKIRNIPSFDISGQMIAYASPDATYAVTRRFFDAAKKEIAIGIYDFSASYIKELLLNAMERGVKLTLMLDINLPVEKQLFEELDRFGATTVPAPSCSNKQVSYFPNCHEKFIIIDNEWVLVQSGNYSKASIPFNEKDGGDPEHFKTGNRDMGIAIQSADLAAFFKRILKGDIKLVTEATTPEGMPQMIAAVGTPLLVDLVPQNIPEQLFPSKLFTPSSAVRVQPVLSPDNYMSEVLTFLKSAKKSIYIENQYIKSEQPKVAKLLEVIREATSENENMDVRIILGKIFSKDDIPKEEENLRHLKEQYGLNLGENIRYIDTKRLVHCHNKLIIVDEKAVLISSQNWSDTAVSENREAGVIIYYPQAAKYYAQIFEYDWATGQKKIPVPGAVSHITQDALTRGNYSEVSLADYEEV